VIGGNDRATLIRPDGTGRHDILVNTVVTAWDPVWSPDGNQLAFEGNGARGSQLYVVDADGTNRRQVTATPNGCPNGDCTEAVNPAWSPDGSRIAYVAPEHVGGIFSRTALMVVDVTTGKTTEVYGTDRASLGRPTWSPDSQSIALEIDRYVGSIEISEIKDTAIAVIDLRAADHTPKTITDPKLLAGYPVWHPTLDRIVFRSNRVDNGTGALLDPAAPSDLYTIKSDGSGLTKVTSNAVGGQIVRAPSWTPDGRILFTAHNPISGSEFLRVIDADGKNEASATGSIDTTGQGRWRPGT
jgi:Tol biopolymer transport system component